MRFLARTGDVSDSIAVELALEERADKRKASMNWRELWDEEESVRTLALWGLAEFRPASTEVVLHRFIKAHAQFFYSDKAHTQPHRARAVILWPHLNDLEQLWRTTKHEDYHAAAKEMAKILRRAKLDPPAFG